ncbi:MAG: lysophospholipase [Candidatus Pristimantibacillus sp.]
MKRSEWTITGENGSSLYVREWQSEHQSAQAVIVIIHGMGEHGERYTHTASKLTAAGFIVIAYDQQGHGRSSGKRGHLPSIIEATSNAALILRQAGERHEGLPHFLYGHSMGGNIAINFALRQKPAIQGLILTSPWLRLAFNPPAVQLWVGRRIAAIAPSLTQSTGLKPEDLYRPGYVGASSTVTDLLCHTKITVQTFMEINAAGEWAIEHGNQLTMPILLMHGDADRITSYKASAELADHIGDKSCEFITWEGCYHELHNDLDADQVIDTIARWLKRQL